MSPSAFPGPTVESVPRFLHAVHDGDDIPRSLPAGEPVPPGKLAVTVTYLVMTGRPVRPPHPAPLKKLALLRAEQPTVSWYRYLYDTVGEPWLWSDRRRLDPSALAEVIGDPRTELYVLFRAGVPAGFGELFRRDKAATEIRYFGIMPEFIGIRLGTFFLDAVLGLAWQAEPERVLVDTCDLDHPRALAVYQRAGFVPYRQDHRIVDDPRVTGILPRHAAPQHPIVGG